MKKTLLFLLLLVSCAVYSQVIFNKSFSHMPLYGEYGTCLFPMDEQNFAILSGQVECDRTAGQINDDILSWLGKEVISMQLEIDKDEKFISNRQILFKAKMPVGSKLIGTPTVATYKELYWEVSESDVEFVCQIDIRDNKFRYKFFQITADRWMLRGDAETEGPINDLHWQRINCLEKSAIQKQKNTKKHNEYLIMIEKEKDIYQREYEAMMRLVDDLRNCVVRSEADF